MKELGEFLTDEDAKFWMNDPSLNSRRLIISAGVVRELIEEYLDSIGHSIGPNNAWFWNTDGACGPEIIVVAMPDNQD